jgi:polysaccharide deacetylase family protein (PEP-CTERM system associated)
MSNVTSRHGATPPAVNAGTHLLTFDVEHWYEGFRYRGLDGWQAYPLRDDKIMEQLLDKLGEAGQRGTLFFTGRYAEDFPHIVRRAARDGHEIASHSYSHMVLSRMKGQGEFRADLLRSVKILEDLSGGRIKGYRAPKWSISDQNRQEVLSALVEAGFEYDSSVFPKLFASTPGVLPHRVTLNNGASLWEIPATTHPLFSLRMPVAGGLYFRLFPEGVTHRAFSTRQRAGQPGMIYLHPYDMDAECPRLPGGSALFQWLRYYGVGETLGRLDEMLRGYHFVPVLDYVRQLNQASPRP